MQRYLLGFALLTVFGWAKLPFEERLTGDLHGAHFLEYQLNLNIRQQVGQMGFVAALSGYRAVLADYLWIDAYTTWTRTEWGRLKLKLDVVTALQPRSLTFWDESAWHMAWNASVNVRQDKAKQPREALRMRAEQDYIRIGEQFLLEGIQHNPDRAFLFERLGRLYWDKMHDYCRASWAFFEAAKRPDVAPYVMREAVYALAQCPGHDREAYLLAVALYRKGVDERLPTLLRLIADQQVKLNIPPSERIDITEDLKAATPH